MRGGFGPGSPEAVGNRGEKLASKSLDMIVLNDALDHDAVVGVETNRGTIIARSGSDEEIPLMLKREIADIILDRVLDRMRLADADSAAEVADVALRLHCRQLVHLRARRIDCQRQAGSCDRSRDY